MRSTRVLAISGSLRAASYNTAVLRAAELLAPDGVQVSLLAGLAELPHFNPDLDGEDATPPARVAALRRAVAEADGLMICSPEYAHGVPGSLKNALDWLVSAPEAVGKPVALINASPRSWHAHASLFETLRTMSLNVLTRASVVLPLGDRNADAEAIAADAELAAVLRGSLAILVRAARERPGSAPGP